MLVQQPPGFCFCGRFLKQNLSEIFQKLETQKFTGKDRNLKTRGQLNRMRRRN